MEKIIRPRMTLFLPHIVSKSTILTTPFSKRNFVNLCKVNIASKNARCAVGPFGNVKETIPLCMGCCQRRYESNSKQVDALKKEMDACMRMLTRSGFSSTAQVSNLCKSAMEGTRLFSSSPQQQQMDRDRENGPNPPKDPKDDEEKMPLVARLMMMFWMGFLLYVIFRVQTGEDASMYKFVSWNEFVHEMLAKGEVDEVVVRPEAELAFIKLHPGAVIKGRQVGPDIYTLKITDANKFEAKLRQAEAAIGVRPDQGISISYQRENMWIGLVFAAIIAGAFFLILKNTVNIQLPNPTDMFASQRKAKFVRADLQTAEGKGVTFRDVAGLHEPKMEVMEFVDYLKRPEKYKLLGGKIPAGALLLGPPGCGKTLLAKAVATEAKVPFLAMAGSEFVEMLGGLGAARVRDLFKEARENAPCIIYIDEIDAIGRKRGGDNWSEASSEEEHTLNQLLVEMDGMGTTGGVIMLASTNRQDILDKALLRPGRFDRHIMIDLPTLAERKEIFEMYLSKLRLSGPPSAYSERLSHLSPGMSGADIANVCNEAALHAARDMKTAITSNDFDYAVERVVAGVAKKSRVLSPQETRIVAFHEAGHALVGWLLEHTDTLLRVSIVPRTSAALGFAQYVPEDKYLVSKEEIFEKMCMGLGGRVAESLTFNSVTSGAQNDLQKVTKMATTMIRQMGMNDRIGHLSFPPESDGGYGKKPYSKNLGAVMDQEAKMLVAQAYKATEKLLQENKEKLKVIAEALLEKEVLNYTDMEQLVGPPPRGKKPIQMDWGDKAQPSTPAASK